MTNLEGRVIRRTPGAAAAGRRPRRPADDEAAGRPARPRPVLLRRPARGLRRAAAGQRRRHRRLRRHHLRADRRRAGRLLAVPRREIIPGTPRLFADALPDPRRPGQLHPGATTAHRPRRPDADYPVRADHRPADGAVPERHPDPAGAGAVAWCAEPDAQLHPDLARRLGIAASRHGRAAHPPRRGGLPGPAHRRHPAGRALRAVPLGRRLRRERADQPGAGPALEDARVQGLRGRPEPDRRPGRRRAAHHRAGTADRATVTRTISRHAAPPDATLNQLPHNRPRRKDSRMHHAEPFPARRLPLRRGRARQAGAARAPSSATSCRTA